MNKPRIGCKILEIRNGRRSKINSAHIYIILDNKLHQKYIQQEIYIAKSAALNFLFFCLFVATPNLSYGLLGTVGLLSNKSSWILGMYV